MVVTDRLIKYKPNTLEMDYAYEVHEDATLGLMIDLIDPAKYESESAIRAATNATNAADRLTCLWVCLVCLVCLV